MLANQDDSLAHFGTLGRDVHKPATFRHELLDFIVDQLPRWRDRPDRPVATAETALTSQLCSHLNSASRLSAGWDILQFRVEEPDERRKGRKIDLVPSPSGAVIFIEGRRHSDFDMLMPIECKRFPVPVANDRDEREYVISRYSSTGGIQRFKEGFHGAAHTFGAMIGYVQDQTASFWSQRVSSWIEALSGTQQGWSIEDLLQMQKSDLTARVTVFHSSHKREQDLPVIELRHLWIEIP